jgi:hypothetical protein
MCSRGISNGRIVWVRRRSPGGREKVLIGKIDLLKRQRRTWAKIPTKLQDMILNQVRATLQEMILQNNGPEEENTVGFEDDHEALEAELVAREAVQDAKRRVVDAFRVTLGTARRDVTNSSPARSITGRSALGEGDLPESQEHWFVPRE